MGYISNKDGSYYEGDLQYGDIEVPDRPSSNHQWINSAWVLSVESQLKDIERAIEEYHEEVAKADGWRNRDSLMLRIGHPNPWQAKALAYATWVDECYVAAHLAQVEILAGRMPMPSPEEAVAALPLMVWPV